MDIKKEEQASIDMMNGLVKDFEEGIISAEELKLMMNKELNKLVLMEVV